LRFSRFFVLLVLAALLDACSTPQVAPTVAGLPPGAGYARGIDMATDSSDVTAQLQGRPWLQFVARYYRDPASRFPALTPSEAQRLSALGVKIVAVWEWHSSTPSYFTYATGYNDALSAARQASAVGQPTGSGIYFAVDFNARGAALYQVDQYFRGVNAGLAAAGGGRPQYRVGVYGSGAVCSAVRGAGLAQYAWLSGSTSWEGTAGYNGWNIRQAPAAARFAQLSFDHDANEARADYGGFQLGDYAKAVTPASAVMSVASAAPIAAATVMSSAAAAVAPPSSLPPPPPAPPSPTPAPAVQATAVPTPPSAPSSPTPTPAVQAMAAPPPPPAAPPSTPLPKTPTPPTAPPAAAIASAAPAPPPPKPVSRAAAEVAALAAEEPPAAARVSSAPAAPRMSEESEKRETRGRARHPERLAAREERHETSRAHIAKGGVAAHHKAYAAAAGRGAAEPPRHTHETSAAGHHERAHIAAAPLRAQEHGAHVQPVKAKPAHAVEHPVRHNGEHHKSHHEEG